MKHSKSITPIGMTMFFIVAIYLAIAWMAFQWRNPKCNEMAFYRHLWSVVTWKKLPTYQ